MKPLMAVLPALLLLGSAGLAQDRLPDGGVAMSGGAGVVKAWYGQPVTRYGHAVLGDAIEGGALLAVDAAGQTHRLALPHHLVFEDITPRLADLDGDGTSEIVTISSDLAAGAAVAVYGMAGGRLSERAATPPIGQPHRWLSIAAIADFTDDPGLEIAIVKTPHIGGVLEILSLAGNGLTRIRPALPGFSTHVIGSREVSLAHSQDIDGDGFAELALPSQNRLGVTVLGFMPVTKTVGSFVTGAPIIRPLGDVGAMLTPAGAGQ